MLRGLKSTELEIIRLRNTKYEYQPVWNADTGRLEERLVEIMSDDYDDFVKDILLKYADEYATDDITPADLLDPDIITGDNIANLGIF